MPATRGQKRQNCDTYYATEPSTQSSKRRKLTNYVPLHTLLKENGKDTSYGWGIVSFYNKEGNLISFDKLIKYEVDPTLKIARYKAKEFPFNYIEYEDYIISFDEFKINIKRKKDVANLLDFASPDIEDNKEEPKPKTDDDETETEAENDADETETENDDDETETENDDDENKTSFLQKKNPIQIQHPNFHHQHQYQQQMFQQQMVQQQMFQQQFSIQNMIKTEISTNLIPWMKEYIDSELQKLKQ
jgi:hypothetical protein